MEAQCTSKELPSSCGSASTVSHAAPDDVLQSTMMWLFLTIACLMCATEKSGANPEVSMDVVSPFLSCLVVQVTCAVVIRARPTAPGCLPRGLAPGFYQRFVSLLLRTRFMADIYGGHRSKSAGLVRTALSGSELGSLCCPALDCNTKSDSSSPDLLRDLPEILAEVMTLPRHWWRGHWEVLSPPSPWSHHQH